MDCKICKVYWCCAIFGCGVWATPGFWWATRLFLFTKIFVAAAWNREKVAEEGAMESGRSRKSSQVALQHHWCRGWPALAFRGGSLLRSCLGKRRRSNLSSQRLHSGGCGGCEQQLNGNLMSGAPTLEKPHGTTPDTGNPAGPTSQGRQDHIWEGF